jgi:hypothetical protein
MCECKCSLKPAPSAMTKDIIASLGPNMKDVSDAVHRAFDKFPGCTFQIESLVAHSMNELDFSIGDYERTYALVIKFITASWLLKVERRHSIYGIEVRVRRG